MHKTSGRKDEYGGLDEYRRNSVAAISPGFIINYDKSKGAQRELKADCIRRWSRINGHIFIYFLLFVQLLA